MMKKSIKKIGCALILTMGLSMLSGCGSDEVNQDKYIDKYAGYCALGEYKGVAFDKTQTEVTSEMVQAQVDELLATYTVSEEATTGTVKNGDVVNIDFVGSIDGVEFEGGSTQGAGYELTIGSGSMIDGFEEQIIGHDVGETFDITISAVSFILEIKENTVDKAITNTNIAKAIFSASVAFSIFSLLDCLYFFSLFILSIKHISQNICFMFRIS